ncbi:DNA methyltransferase [Castellaniella sp.]|uniref:DNA methyltransferase n=1 Tax=Castellaniella sp. TaxID=1955812 RepID=UPI002AFE279E|nr:DNA methyltransferase [Castellaniella sp.]
MRAYQDAGWIFHSEVCIWKDPVVQQQRTKSLRLLHKQLCKDSSMSGQGLADYVVTFRKPGINETAISGELLRYLGDAVDTSRAAYDRQAEAMRADGKEPWPYKTWVSIMTWQRYASPVWTDIRQTRTLQYRTARDEQDEQHISPLQLDVIERCIDLWSNPGETVLTPFMGIGSEVWCALEAGRRGVGFELKDSYWRQSKTNIQTLYDELLAALLGVAA